MTGTPLAPVRLSPESPWPGLRSYAEDDKEFFFGRDRETAGLLDLVLAGSAVVLYGQSGVGKTSLLQAGLFPRLAEASLFAVRVRFDHGDAAPPLAAQLLSELAATLERQRIQGPRPDAGETLWEFFHRSDVEFWGPRNRLLKPLLVLDQFEEVFTVGRGNERAAARVAQFASDLESLLEHRPPESVRERLERDPESDRKYDLRRQSFKLLLSLREDFLAELDPWRERIPTLLANRFRVVAMTVSQALEVVQRAGSALVEPAVAPEIVDFVSGSGHKAPARAVVDRSVEPALLSLVCDELNRRRLQKGQARITADLLTGERQGILRGYYDRCFDGLHPGLREWTEDELLTSSGYRDRAALEDAVASGFPEGDLRALVDRRLLHREERGGVVWLEFTHDLLTGPAVESRSLRAQRQAKEAIALAADRGRRMRWLRRRLVALSYLLVVALAVTGIVVWRSAGAARNAARAAAIYQKACAGGDATGCYNLGVDYDNGVGVAKDAARAVALYQRACNGGYAAGCNNLGVDYDNGVGVAKDAARAAALYQRACDGGDATGCNNLGVDYDNGVGVARDVARGVALYQKACDGGYDTGCYNLGVDYDNGVGVAKDVARAAALYQKACDSGDAAGCNNLGVDYDNGIGVARDAARAAALYQKACNGDDLAGCTNLGYDYEMGTGVAKDAARAVALYRKACDGGDATGCKNLGYDYETGTGVAKDAARAIALYQKACDSGGATGCNNLGVDYARGLGVAKDDSRAAALYRKACDGGDAVGCGNLGYDYENGAGVSKDLKQAVQFYQKACGLGDQDACSALKRLHAG